MALSVQERADAQRRVVRVLVVGQVVGSAALASAVTVGAFVIQDILGAKTAWSGLASATVTTGTAFMAQALSRLMGRRGRRPGLQLGYLLAVVGGLIAAVGVQHRWLAVFVVGLFLFGNGQASNLLARYAATDLAEPDQRGRAMSTVVFSSTFGAVFGPLLIGPAERLGQSWWGLSKYAGPWVFSSGFFLLAAINTAIRLCPDPMVSAGRLDEGIERTRTLTLRQVVAVIGPSPRARLAVGSMVVSQAAMVAVMTMTPVHMKLHGHESLSQYVVSSHIAGMYAFAPLVGRFSDRRGRVSAILVGAVVLIMSTTLAALSGDVEQLLFPALWGLGLGWNFGLIGGSSLLTESVPADQGVAVQGWADLAMSLCGGIGGFASGFIRKAFGFHMLANGATLGAGLLLVAAYVVRSRDATRRGVLAS